MIEINCKFHSGEQRQNKRSVLHEPQKYKAQIIWVTTLFVSQCCQIAAFGFWTRHINYFKRIKFISRHPWSEIGEVRVSVTWHTESEHPIYLAGRLPRVCTGHQFASFPIGGVILWNTFLNHPSVLTGRYNWANIGHPISLRESILTDLYLTA